jgi:hypothetical protein
MKRIVLFVGATALAVPGLAWAASLAGGSSWCSSICPFCP